jgi:putative ABC transport system permease protein
MIRSLLKIALRNFQKQIGFSILNILGLTIGIAGFIVIAMWVLDELSFDAQHPNADQTFLIYKGYSMGKKLQYNPATPVPLGPTAKADFSEVEQMSRVYDWRASVKYEKKVFFENRVCSADPAYFEMFEANFIEGNPKTAFSEPQSAVISRKIARKYFGEKSPLGKVLQLNSRTNVTVGGVIEDYPLNSSINNDIIVRFDFVEENEDNRNNWGSHFLSTYVKLKKGSDKLEFDKKLGALLQANCDDQKLIAKTLRLDKMHLYSIDGANQRVQYVYLFSAIAVFILLIACINFMNLSTARASRRSKEIGLRKVVGASRVMLIWQFLIESLIYAFVAMMLAMMLVELFRPLFNDISGKNLSINYFNLKAILGGVGIVLFTGLFAGSYPALFLSSFRPIVVLKGAFNIGRKGLLFRKILVILQFSISVFLIICTFVIYLQIKHIQNKDLGFDKENVLILNANGSIPDHFESFKNELLKNPGVLNVSRTSEIPSEIWSIVRGLKWEGMENEDGVAFGVAAVGYDYFETMGMDIVQGRSFSKDYGTDSLGIVFNQKAIEMINWENPIGKTFVIDEENPSKVIGVVRNFNSLPITYEIEPCCFVMLPSWCRKVLIRLQPGNPEQTIMHIEKVFKSFALKLPFTYNFLDERIDQQYQAEQNIGVLASVFALIAILISCLGLFGLAAYAAEQKTKEIGIRKIFGASVTNVVYKLSLSFSVWVIIANIVACPLAFFVMKNWLENYAYSVPLHWWVFAVSALLSLLIAILTVSMQTMRAANRNPIDSLRYE